MPAFRNLSVEPDWFSSIPDIFSFGSIEEMELLWGDDGFNYAAEMNFPEQMRRELGDFRLQEKLLDFFFDGNVHVETQEWIYELFIEIAQGILSRKPKIVGLSLFSYVCQSSTVWLCYFIKKINPNIKIVIGGAGCLNTFTGKSEFVESLINRGLVDYHIRGDGEHSFYEFLIGNTDYFGINSLRWKEMSKEELESIPFPDYRDYYFELYNKKALPIVGSRGCVRRCTFCDYIANWKKFQWRQADDIFKEMLHQYHTYDIRYFKFQDSLTNGNMKEFLKLVEYIANYNKSNPDKSFRWSGYYIFRDWNTGSEKEWALLKQSGAENLAVGIENLNEHIRYAIGKKFSNHSIDLHLQQAKKQNIKLQLLNIVGYVTETNNDIEFIKKWLDGHTEYKDILHIQWGVTLGIFPNTFLEKNYRDFGVEKIGPQPQQWINRSINSTPVIRASWAKELNEYSKNLGYKVADNLDNHYILESLINDKF
jgi:radical SAM superfamily enzyme YgiQ (UPF0313 family)